MKEIDIIAQLSKLKDTDYRNTLAIATIIELLIEKNIITRQEFARKSYYLDNLTLEEIKQNRVGK
ncbi:hypothetical protein [Alkaliphilus hydrothermalis]|uniref:Transcriptional regulator n=1 Tax=Alkaliphilus hydrothermalis TaxID=1482730 RepID=A0ABS2NP23_9FIRM|nr:hypothetical protein [Alkaliphilus hydrothermalis]MBM7614680.1 putative transcriptional regulator [Alkaliphilus hydrothermalis]